MDTLKWHVWRGLPVVTRQCFAQVWPQQEGINLMKATGMSPNDCVYGRGQSQPNVPPTSKA